MKIYCTYNFSFVRVEKACFDTMKSLGPLTPGRKNSVIYYEDFLGCLLSNVKNFSLHIPGGLFTVWGDY